MEPFFKPEDFIHLKNPMLRGNVPEFTATLANNLLKRRTVKVYGLRCNNGTFLMNECMDRSVDTHFAYMTPPEPIEPVKKECGHARANAWNRWKLEIHRGEDPRATEDKLLRFCPDCGASLSEAVKP